MKRSILIALAMLFALTASGQKGRSVSAAPADLREVRRDAAIEKDASSRAGRVASDLQPGTKSRLDLVARKVFTIIARDPGHGDVLVLVEQELGKEFKKLSAQQSDLLCFYVVAELARILSAPEDYKKNLDGMNELSEMTSLRLQMMMDRRSKIIATLSNIMSKISKTSDSVVQNIK